jgi:hypothetical protein
MFIVCKYGMPMAKPEFMMVQAMHSKLMGEVLQVVDIGIKLLVQAH